MSRKRIIARNSVLNGLDLLASLITGLVSSIIVARALGKAKIGEYSVLLWVIATLTMLSAYGIPGAMRKFASAEVGAGDMPLAHAYIRFSFWVQLLFTVVVEAGAAIWILAAIEPARWGYAVPAMLAAAPLMMMGVFTYSLATTENFTTIVLASLSGTIVGFAGVILTVFYGWDLPGLAWSMLLSRVVDLAVRVWSFQRTFGPILKPRRDLFALSDISTPKQRAFLRFAFQATLLMVVQAVLWSRSEVWFLKRYWDFSEVTSFALGFNFLDRIILIPVIVSTAVGASIMVAFGKSRSAASYIAITSVRYLALLTFPLLLGLCALAVPLIRLMYPPEFLTAALPMMIQCILMLPRMLLVPASDLLTAADRQDRLLKWGLVMCVVNLALDAVLVKMGGAIGAAWANGLAQSIATVGLWRMALQQYKLGFPWGKILRIGAASFAMGLTVWGLAQVVRPLLALVLGVPAGAALYPLFLLALRALDSGDRDHLLALQAHVPSPLRGPYQRLVDTLTRA